MSSLQIHSLNAGLFEIRTSYFSKALNEACKLVPGMRWSPERRNWYGYSDAIEQLQEELSKQSIRLGGELPEIDAWKSRDITTVNLTASNGWVARRYQEDGVRFILDKAEEGCLLADGMRVGKSGQASLSARYLDVKTLIICPPNAVGVWARPPDDPKPGELAKWWPESWRGLDDKPWTPKTSYPGVVVLEGIALAKWQDLFWKISEKKEEKRSAEEKQKLKEADAILSDALKELQNTKVVVIHDQIIYAWVEVLTRWNYNFSVFDECFPAGTLVDTPDGQYPIESLCNGNTVLNATGLGQVKTTMTKVVDVSTMIIVDMSDGQSFICTRNHPVLTWRGWVPASRLAPNDIILDAVSTHRVALLYGLRPNQSSRVLSEKESGTLRSSKVSNLQKDEGASSRERDLFDLLWDEIELDKAGFCETRSGRKAFAGSSGEHVQEVQSSTQVPPRISATFERTNVEAQSDVEHQGQSQSSRNETAQWDLETFSTRRQRQEETITGATTASSLRFGLGAFGDFNGNWTIKFLPDLLQDRCSEREIHGCHRSGRSQPFGSQQKGTGQEKGQVSEKARVARISIPERADFERLGLRGPDNQGRVQVYNLSVSGHPSYVINGLVVHNCHAFSSYDTRRSAAAKKLAAVAGYRLGLSGTPMTSRPRDLHNVVDLLCPGRFGAFFRHERQDGTFSKTFCGSFQETVGKGPEAKTVWNHNGKSNVELLHRRLRRMMLRRTAKEVDAELPDKTRQVIDVRIPANKMVMPSMSNLGDRRALRRVLDLTADAKLKPVLDLLKSHLEEGLKVVAFCHRRAFAETLVSSSVKFSIDELLSTYVHGDVSQKERERRIVKAEKHVGPFLFAATIESCSTAIDLSFADVIVFCELTWVPAELSQAEERSYKFGDGRKRLIQYVIARGTGDELILRSVISKLADFEAIVGSTGDRMQADLAGKKDPDAALKRLAAAMEEMHKARPPKKKKREVLTT